MCISFLFLQSSHLKRLFSLRNHFWRGSFVHLIKIFHGLVLFLAGLLRKLLNCSRVHLVLIDRILSFDVANGVHDLVRVHILVNCITVFSILELASTVRQHLLRHLLDHIDFGCELCFILIF